MGGAGILSVALAESILALEEGEGLLVLGEVGGCLTVLTEAGKIEAHLVERVSFVEEMSRGSAIVNKIECGLSSGCWWEGTYIITVVGLGIFQASAELAAGVLLGNAPLI